MNCELACKCNSIRSCVTLIFRYSNLKLFTFPHKICMSLVTKLIDKKKKKRENSTFTTLILIC